jgi:hypothetical protein
MPPRDDQREDDMKAAIILFADTDRPEGLGRLANALTTAREFIEAGDEIAVIFDGAGVKWVPEVAQPDHKYHGLFEEVRSAVTGACVYCSRAYGVTDGSRRRGSRSWTSSAGIRASARSRPAVTR